MTVRHKWLYFFVILLAFFLRFYRLGEVPVSLYWDEVAQGYNSYSILKTGKDEYNTRFPFYFRSFDDYKNPGQIYLSIVPISIFGLNEFSVRFTSAFLGSLTVIVTMAIAFQLGIQQRSEHFAEKFTLICGLLIGILPWHLQFSRAAFEANVGLFFLTAGVYAFLLSLKRQNLLWVSLIGFVASMYFYGSFIVIAPLLFLTLLILSRKYFANISKQNSIKFIIAAILLCAPIIYHTFSTRGLTRARQVQVFDNIQELHFESANNILSNQNVWWARVIYNRRITTAKVIMQNYFANFSPQFLFLKGDGNGRHSVSGMGLFFWWQLPFLLCGLYRIMKGRGVPRSLLFGWLIITPIPSALSIPAPHSLRSLSMAIPLSLICGYGLTKCFFLRKISAIKYVLVTVIALSLGFYLFSYYFISSKTLAADWGDGYKQMVKEVDMFEEKYNKILISGYYWKPYIYVLFYNQIDPEHFQKIGNQTGFGKYVFGGTYWDKDEKTLESVVDLADMVGTKEFLAALSPPEYLFHEDSLHMLNEIKDRSGSSKFIIAESSENRER